MTTWHYFNLNVFIRFEFFVPHITATDAAANSINHLLGSLKPVL